MYKVIIIEDEVTVRRGIVLTIDWASLGCMVVGEAENGESGAELVQRLSPDIVITDVQMPRMDGVEMIDRLRRAGCRSRFIILTAHSDFKYAQSAVRLGVSDYLLKPLMDGDLEQAVKTLIHNSFGGSEVPPESRRSEEAFPIFEFRTDRKTPNTYVEAAIHYIQNHYKEDISISSVAKDLEISEGYLSRVFKKETNYTFTNYLVFYRIRLAMELLKNCRTKVYEVADQVGYSDTAYFSSQFKKNVGLSPSEYQGRYGSMPV